jgi:hypothetical protein
MWTLPTKMLFAGLPSQGQQLAFSLHCTMHFSFVSDQRGCLSSTAYHVHIKYIVTLLFTVFRGILMLLRFYVLYWPLFIEVTNQNL